MMPYDIDVVIPTFNYSKYLLYAVKSVENQTVKPKSIIIVDDGSTDDTEEIITSYNSSIPIGYLKKNNGGLSSARNAGIIYSNSTYIGFLDSDDYWLPQKLEEQLKLFNLTNTDELGLVYCDFEYIDEDGLVILNKAKNEIDIDCRGYCFNKLLMGNKINGSASATILKRKCFEKVGLFDENLKMGEDWDMWLRIAKEFKIDFVNNIFVQIRRHSCNMQNDKIYVYTNEIGFYNKWIVLPNVDPNPFSKRIYDNIVSLILNLHFKQAIYSMKILKNCLKPEVKYILFRNYSGVNLFTILLIIKQRVIKKLKKIFFNEIS